MNFKLLSNIFLNISRISKFHLFKINCLIKQINRWYQLTDYAVPMGNSGSWYKDDIPWWQTKSICKKKCIRRIRIQKINLWFCTLPDDINFGRFRSYEVNAASIAQSIDKRHSAFVHKKYALRTLHNHPQFPLVNSTPPSYCW